MATFSLRQKLFLTLNAWCPWSWHLVYRKNIIRVFKCFWEFRDKLKQLMSPWEMMVCFLLPTVLLYTAFNDKKKINVDQIKGYKLNGAHKLKGKSNHWCAVSQCDKQQRQEKLINVLSIIFVSFIILFYYLKNIKQWKLKKLTREAEYFREKFIFISNILEHVGFTHMLHLQVWTAKGTKAISLGLLVALIYPGKSFLSN